MSGVSNRLEEYFQKLISEIFDEISEDKLQQEARKWFDSFVEVKNMSPGESDENTVCSCTNRPAQRLRQRELEVGDSTALDDFLSEFLSGGAEV